MVDPVTIASLLISAGIPVLGYFLGRRFSGEESNEFVAGLAEKARDLESKIIEVLGAEEGISSKKELAKIRKKAAEYTAAVESQKQSRIDLETKLTAAHADVIARESAHQEMKAEKEEDHVVLQTVLANYSDISSESVALERRLAESLRSIDKMSVEVSMSDDQRAILEALSAALTNASAQLRDVIVAHQNVYERLDALKSQYTDLEGEYIKLVELQLGA